MRNEIKRHISPLRKIGVALGGGAFPATIAISDTFYFIYQVKVLDGEKTAPAEFYQSPRRPASFICIGNSMSLKNDFVNGVQKLTMHLIIAAAFVATSRN